MNILSGDKLTTADKNFVLAAFIHRYTGDHLPVWVKWEPVQFKNDKEWLKNTDFNVTKSGSVDRRYIYCMSSPTWPNNPELRN